MLLSAQKSECFIRWEVEEGEPWCANNTAVTEQHCRPQGLESLSEMDGTVLDKEGDKRYHS